MNLLEGKTALICGVANDRSIAWGITRAFHEAGATIALSYAGEKLERRVRPLAEQVDCDFVENCDVSSDEDIKQLFTKVKQKFGTIDILVHAIAFANRDDLAGQFVDTSREGFLLAQNISVYSLIALSRESKDLMPNGGSILTLSYYGSEKAVPKYNVMGVAKAGLESSVRYLASDLGPKGIRVNAISAGPIKTLSASGIKDFRSMLNTFPSLAPLRRNVTLEDIGGAATFLASDASAGVTGEIMYVDAGYNTVGLSLLEKDEG
ncbi:MAG: enoyl-ACP reductase [Dehalococcoidia bacterium]|nr:enoyl-ACP reductase [Dehalococcoidia bacterium]